MDLKKCKSGHFYDGDKYTECPHCKNNVENRSIATLEKKKITENRDSGNLTRSIFDMNTSKEVASKKKKAEETPEYTDVHAVQVQRHKAEYGPVVGWLVGITGNEYGHSYELYAGSNTIGSSLDNVVSITEDSYLCSVSHGVICYQMETGLFFYDIQDSKGRVMINNCPVQENMYIGYMDVIEIGGSSYMLVPLCKDGFSWWQTNDNTEIYAASGISYMEDEIKDDIMYQPDAGYILGYEGEEQDLTSVLISSPWRCESCNALNSMMASTCRVCGNNK